MQQHLPPFVSANRALRQHESVGVESPPLPPCQLQHRNVRLQIGKAKAKIPLIAFSEIKSSIALLFYFVPLFVHSDQQASRSAEMSRDTGARQQARRPKAGKEYTTISFSSARAAKPVPVKKSINRNTGVCRARAKANFIRSLCYRIPITNVHTIFPAAASCLSHTPAFAECWCGYYDSHKKTLTHTHTNYHYQTEQKSCAPGYT